ncbi:hypothetical protein GCM10025880_38140 [Methylorubrum aminovorans]|nr:hypothetical protein GCM10025880_38140 [Methylorubrum aminovorans]
MAALPVNLDMDVLRTFVTGIDLGSFAKAADCLGRSPSAISLQMRKLEDQVGQTLLRRNGRGLALTEPGEMLLGYARRLLDLNDAAVSAVATPALSGSVRLGLPQDFTETGLPTVLARFARLHPAVRVEVHVERDAVLRSELEAGRLDLALVWDATGAAGEEAWSRTCPWSGSDRAREWWAQPIARYRILCRSRCSGRPACSATPRSRPLMRPAFPGASPSAAPVSQVYGRRWPPASV